MPEALDQQAALPTEAGSDPAQLPASAAPVDSAPTDPSTPPSPTQTAPEGQAPEHQAGLQRRFAELTRRNREAEQRAVAAETALAEQRARLDAIEAAQAARVAPENQPLIEPVFESPDQYQRDMAAYTRTLAERSARDILAAQRQADEQQRNAAMIRAEQDRVRADFARRADEARAAPDMPDYDEVTSNPDLPISAMMAAAITRSAAGPKIAYHLGKNPAEAARIAALAPPDQFLAIGALGHQLGTPAAPRTSAAPAPIVPVRPSAGAPRELSELSMEEYAAQRRKH